MCALLNPEIRQWLDIGTSALTGIGTLLAVVLALYLSRQDRRARMAVSAAITYLVQPGQTLSEGQRLYTLTATNIGFVTVTVTNLCWSVGFFRKTVLHQVRAQGWLGDTVPKELKHGQYLAVSAPEGEYIDGLFHLLEQIRKHPIPRLALLSVRAGVETSLKKRFFGRPNWDLNGVIRRQFDIFMKSRRS
jgi:hypothetical protein